MFSEFLFALPCVPIISKKNQLCKGVLKTLKKFYKQWKKKEALLSMFCGISYILILKKL